jgi:surface antigen
MASGYVYVKATFQETSMRLIALILATACASPAALAQNWIGLLKNTPAERFDEEDIHLFLDASRKALNEAPDNQPQSWENPKTRARGEITVLRSFESKGRPCKEVRVRNEAQGRKGDNKLNLCKVDGKWRLLSASQLGKAK